MDILSEVKKSLGITGNYQDDLLTNYINEVKAYMVDAGVSQAVADSDKCIGVISRGVCDLWNYGAAGGTLSNYFMQRVIQLSYYTGEAPEPIPDEPEKLKIVSTITDKVENETAGGNENGIYQKGDAYYLDFLTWFYAGRDSTAGSNITVGQIDNPDYYPPKDLFYTGIYNDSYLCTIKIWTHGLITVLPTVDVKVGDWIRVQYSGEYGGV